MTTGLAVETTFGVSYFSRTTDNQPIHGTMSWTEVCTMFENPIVEFVKANVPLFSPATFSPPVRAKKNVQGVSLLMYDIDHDADIEEINSAIARLGCAAIVGSTHSHMRQVDGKAAEPRFRIVIGLKEAIPCNQFSTVWAAGKQALGVFVDESAKDPSRMYFKPANASTGLPYYCRIHNGPLLDWKSLPPPTTLHEDRKAAVRNGDVINNGSRNATLTSLAGSMRRRDMSSDAILAALRSENAAKCLPPLPDDEVQKIVKSVSQYAPPNTRSHDALQPISCACGHCDNPVRIQRPSFANCRSMPNFQ